MLIQCLETKGKMCRNELTFGWPVVGTDSFYTRINRHRHIHLRSKQTIGSVWETNKKCRSFDEPVMKITILLMRLHSVNLTHTHTRSSHVTRQQKRLCNYRLAFLVVLFYSQTTSLAYVALLWNVRFFNWKIANKFAIRFHSIGFFDL